MTDEKKVGGKLTDEQLGLGLDALEKLSLIHIFAGIGTFILVKKDMFH